MTAWTEQRTGWLRDATPVRLLAVIASVADGYRLDENLGDTTERAETILWLATRGRRGCEWGHAAEPARISGGWADPEA
jgi:hypothetical protein